jgi:hypothetical protein
MSDGACESNLPPKELYLGTKVVELMPVQGQFYAFLPGITVIEVPSVKSTKSALKRLKDNSELGEGYERVYLPALPSSDLLLRPGSASPSPFPVSVKAPVPSSFQGVQSGKRSAVVECEGKRYRLKGCGNLEQGFVVENMAFPEGGRELRGCCFDQTLARELYMSHLISEVLQPYGLEVGNRPIGYWKYESDPSETVQFELPLIEKYCGIYETMGEKRLGSHLLSGLSMIVEQLSHNFDLNAVKQFFPSTRLIDGQVVHPRRLLATSGPLDDGPFLAEFTRAGVYANNDRLLDLLTKDWQTAITSPGFPLAWLPEAHPDHLSSLSTEELTATLCLIAYQVGREAGEVKRHLQDAEISWGYFIDHNPFEPHCNAHQNNFIILNTGHEHITAPVDFDMAFTFRGFMNNLDEELKGVHDYTLFQSFVNSERGALEEALVGVENMANFQYKEGNREETALDIAFLDLILLGYREGFDLRPASHSVAVKGNKELWRTVELCLACTQDYTAY